MGSQLWHRLAFRLLLVALGPALLVSAALSTPMIELRRQQLIEQAGERVVQAGRTTEAIFAERLAFAELMAELLVVLISFPPRPHSQEECAARSARFRYAARG